MSTETTGSSTPPPEPWWKKAPQAPPPKWASPAAVRRQRLLQTTLPSRLTARAESNAEGVEANADVAERTCHVNGDAHDTPDGATSAMTEATRG